MRSKVGEIYRCNPDMVGHGSNLIVQVIRKEKDEFGRVLVHYMKYYLNSKDGLDLRNMREVYEHEHKFNKDFRKLSLPDKKHILYLLFK